MPRRTDRDRAKISHRTKEAMRRKRNRGERISRYAPIGFRFEKGRLVPDERERAILGMILEWRASGLSYRTIAARLDAREKPRKGTKRWYAATVRDAIRERPITRNR